MFHPPPRRLLLCSMSVVLGIVLSRGAMAQATRALSAPEWIWAEEEEDTGTHVTLGVSFDGVVALERARLRCAADFCRARVVLNGRPVLTIEDYGPWVDEDITARIEVGTNELSLDCVGSAGPSAVALSLVLTDSEGSSREIVTGAHWEARGGDAQAEETSSSREGGPWRRAVSFGPVAPELWDAWTRSIEITPFDDYEQWRDALGTDGAAPSSFLVPDGFEIEELRSARSQEGSWVSLAVDPRGRMVIAREDRGLLRMTLSGDGAVSDVETIDDSLEECRGLLFAHDALYVNANVSKGLYRLRDSDGDDRFDEVKLLRTFSGGGGHGRNDLALGPDGMIYSIHGDAVDVPKESIVDHTSPYREARRGRSTREGHLVRTDHDGERWELVCAGLRNPFGIAFHPEDGELFTYDADAEHDMGAPWYRPTRVVHLAPGADYGWRGVTGRWPPYDPDVPENGLPVMDIGKGSPTAVKFGQRSRFPPPYRRALFILDWAYGRILAVHLVARGAGYTARAEVFLRGRPLNVTDLDFGPDGAMYFVTGGRKTQSALYRVRYVGPEVAPPPASRHQARREEHSRGARRQRRLLEALLGSRDRMTVGAVWPYLDHPDPTLRHAARVALEQHPTRSWRDRALRESARAASLTALLALARSGETDVHSRIVGRLSGFDYETLDATQRLLLLRVYALCLTRTGGLEPALLERGIRRLDDAFPDATSGALMPIGLGRTTNRELARLLVSLGATGAVAKTLPLLANAASQEDRLHFLRVLSRARDGWTAEARRDYFRALREAERFRGGRGMPGFIETIRDQATRTLSETEREDLATLIDPAGAEDPGPLAARPLVKEWTTEELIGSLDEVGRRRDFARGRRIFREAQCSRCHRVGATGEATGPDLTSIAGRFSRRDIVESIIAPSRVVAPPYQSVEVVTTDGRVLVGQIVDSGDYRSRRLRIATDPLRPARVVEVRKQDVALHRESKVSPMPEGLLNTLEREEILDLLAYLESGGDERHPCFR